MDSGTGDRGVSEVMGFILVFGMLVIAFTVYQGIVVPDQNRQVEFQHNQEVQGQLQDLRNAILSTASTGSGQAVSVTLGATYPKRTIAQNLGVSGGSVQTVSADAIRLSNARALDGETRDYLDGSERTFETKPIRYTPVYSFYPGAPETVYENPLAYNRFDEANLTLTDQVLVDGRRITLIAINGSLTKSQRETVSISTEAISASSNRVAVTNTTGERLNVTVPTSLGESKWEEILADEMDGSGYVEDVSEVAGANAVNITMQGGVTYDLRMAKVGVGDVTSEEGPEYITVVEGNGTSVPEGGTRKIEVEVRDRFNNPVSNVTVSRTSTPSWGTVTPASGTTDSDGRMTFTYTADDDVDDTQRDDVELSFDGDSTDRENATVYVDVLDSDGSGSGGGVGGGDEGGDVEEVNPGRSGTIILDSQSTISGNGDQYVTLTFKNTSSESISITDARVSFYFNGDPGSGDDDPDHVYMFASAQGVNWWESTRFDFGKDFAPLSEQIPLNPTPSDGSDTTVVDLYFNEDVENDDFYVISLKFSNGDTYTYFVSHP